MRKGRGLRSERWPRAGWMNDESSVAARTTPPAAAYVRPRSAMRNGSSAGTAPWFMSLTTWPAASQPRARRSVWRLAMSFAMVRDGKREKKIFLERKRRGEGSRREDFLEGEEKREARGYGCTYSRRMRVSVYCSECLARIELPEPLGAPAGSVSCPSEHSSIAFSHSDAVRGGERVDVCSRCVSTALFSQKDFDPGLRCGPHA